jgi:ankyrin repeat protein
MSDELRDAIASGDCGRVARHIVGCRDNGHFSDNGALLHTAAAEGHLDVIELLAESECVTNPNWDVVLETAAMRGHYDIVKFLLTKCTPNRGALEEAAWYSHDHIVALLLSTRTYTAGDLDATLANIPHGLRSVVLLVEAGARKWSSDYVSVLLSQPDEVIRLFLQGVDRTLFAANSARLGTVIDDFLVSMHAHLYDHLLLPRVLCDIITDYI